MYGNSAFGPNMRLSINEVLSNTENKLTIIKAIANLRGALTNFLTRFDRSPNIRATGRANARITGANHAGANHAKGVLTNRRVIARDHKAEMVMPPVVIQSRRSSQTEVALMVANSAASTSPDPVLRIAIRNASSAVSPCARSDDSESRRCDSSSSRSSARKLADFVSSIRQR